MTAIQSFSEEKSVIAACHSDINCWLAARGISLRAAPAALSLLGPARKVKARPRISRQRRCCRWACGIGQRGGPEAEFLQERGTWDEDQHWAMRRSDCELPFPSSFLRHGAGGCMELGKLVSCSGDTAPFTHKP